MELQHLEGRNRASELDKMVENATRASNFLKALAHVIDIPGKRWKQSFQAGTGCESLGFF